MREIVVNTTSRRVLNIISIVLVQLVIIDPSTGVNVSRKHAIKYTYSSSNYPIYSVLNTIVIPSGTDQCIR